MGFRVVAEIANVLVSYGSQIEFALLCNMTESQLSDVTEACLNARFGFEDIGVNSFAAALKIIGPRLYTASFREVDNGTHDIDELTNAWNK